MSVLSKLNDCVKTNRAGFIILIDPDKKNDKKIDQMVQAANIYADAIFVGGSIMMDKFYHERVKRIKSISKIPVILFPGGVNQLNDYYDGGSPTTVEFISGTKPLSPAKPDVIISHALAAQYLGMKLIYLEAGSGAKNKIPEDVIKKVASEIDIGLIVGGGIRTPQMAKNIVEAGASHVVIGSAIEDSTAIAKEFSSAIHNN